MIENKLFIPKIELSKQPSLWIPSIETISNKSTKQHKPTISYFDETEEYEDKQYVTSVLNTDIIVFEDKTVEQSYKDKYPFIKNDTLLYDIQQYTKTVELAKTSEIAIKDTIELANYRVMDKDTLIGRGIFYSEGPLVLQLFNTLKGTTILYHTLATERYLLPIKLINGDVFQFIGYDPEESFGKYQFPENDWDTIDWFHSSTLVGNLDSINLYEGTDLYVVEGMMDAYRVNEVFKAKSIALLGIKGKKTKARILNRLKDKGLRLIAVPDADEAGSKSWLNDINIFDKIYKINSEDPVVIHGEKFTFKDFDEKYKFLKMQDML